MPFDADDDDDAPVGGAPLPPDDRLWRHPSEVGAALSVPPPAPSSSDSSGTRTWAVALVAGLIGSAMSLGFVAASGRLSNDVVEKPVVEKVAVRPSAEINAVSSGGPSIMTIAKNVSPAITRIEVGDDDKGSGILVRDDGYVVTNAHVVDHAPTLRVVLADGTAIAARVVGTDSLTDIAVLKVDHGHLPVAVLGSAVDLQSGQSAVAIGSPIGQSGGPSVTVGVISAVGRHMVSEGGVELRDMIEVGVPSANGSSGGALCDGSGSVVGMTTAAQSDDTAANGLSFAIPMDIVRGVVDDIIATGTARHAWLGLEGADLDAEMAKQVGLVGGAKITKVVDGSPAAEAGLAADDVIISIDGTKISSMSAFVVALRGHHPGDAVALEVMRGAQPQTMTVTLAEKHA
ncbi:MAG TPA: trypsin-like peptidase domain-containing protein [Acidimicrobiales bacterium]|nr:trypsin-like peptidase domain-containing protein [Acidimicrobiales bacterium]